MKTSLEQIFNVQGRDYNKATSWFIQNRLLKNNATSINK